MNMNIKKICFLSVLIISITSMAIDNPNVGSPLSPSRTPTQSGQPQRFITQPGVNAYGRSGNDIVSGNVGGFKYFRGVVPYGSSYYSRAYSSSSDSAAVSSFLRRSADPLVNDRRPGQTQSYYEPRRTVSSLRRPDGTSGLSSPQQIGQAKSSPYKISAPTQQLKLNPVYRPINANEMDLEMILAKQQAHREKAMKQAESDKDEEPITESFFDVNFKPEQAEDQNTEEDESTSEDNIEVDPLEMSPAERVAVQIRDQAQEDESVQESDQASEDQQGQAPDKASSRDWMNPKTDLLPKTDFSESVADQGRQVLGEHETFESLADEKFDNYMLLAEKHAKKGQFYKAADIYALANVWKPEDARGYMGQSFSLFFAGEYMSCAYYLTRAIELNPDLALGKYNIADLSGDRDAFEDSLLEVQSAQQRSAAPELAFLMSYIAYQEGRAQQAVRLIKDAKNGMPDSIAVNRLKNIIDPEPLFE